MTEAEEDNLALPQTSLKYLQSGKLEKETIKDYINTSRQLLRKNLTSEAKKKDLTELKLKYKAEVSNFADAKNKFQEDY